MEIGDKNTIVDNEKILINGTFKDIELTKLHNFLIDNGYNRYKQGYRDSSVQYWKQF